MFSYFQILGQGNLGANAEGFMLLQGGVMEYWSDGVLGNNKE
jgi:hypothetical protein